MQEGLITPGTSRYIPKVLQVKAFVSGSVRNAYPGDVALPDMLDSRSAINEVVDLALEHRLEVLLHLPTGDFDHPFNCNLDLTIAATPLGSDQHAHAD